MRVTSLLFISIILSWTLGLRNVTACGSRACRMLKREVKCDFAVSEPSVRLNDNFCLRR